MQQKHETFRSRTPYEEEDTCNRNMKPFALESHVLDEEKKIYIERTNSI